MTIKEEFLPVQNCPHHRAQSSDAGLPRRKALTTGKMAEFTEMFNWEMIASQSIHKQTTYKPAMSWQTTY